MNPGRRAAATEYAQRVNQAAAWLRQWPPTEVVQRMTRLYGLSERQARRYVQAAQRGPVPLAIPEAKVVFTVKVPASLPARLRQMARHEGRSLSEVVSQALEEFLQRREAGHRGSRQEG